VHQFSWACALSGALFIGCGLDQSPNDSNQPIEGDGSSTPDGPRSSEGKPSDDETSLSDIIITPVNNEAPTLPAAIITPAGAPSTTPPMVDAMPVCGNGVREQGEPCDSAADGCCAQDCSALLPSGTLCRPAEGDCDLAETCTGESAACPADRVASWEQTCRAASEELCDAAEHCTGETKTCPPDVPAPAGTVCGQPSLPCDAPELCDGESRACPPATVSIAPPGTVCRAANAACDAAERCNGETYDCPPDGVAPDTTECRPMNGVCDAPEFCDGETSVCPVDGFLFGTRAAPCRLAQAGLPCDAADYCDGSGPDCPADGFLEGTVCRAAAPDSCDAEEACAGDSGSCPPDGFLPDRTACNGGLGQCSLNTCCPGATLASQPSGLCSAKDGGKVVFVTSSDVQGDVDMDGADKLCNDVARSANLAGGFRAWLSSFEQRPDANAGSRIAEGPYVLVDETPFSNSRSDLLAGTVINGLSKTEWGVTRNVSVWTGTTPAGVAAMNPASGAALTCSDWASLPGQGMSGLSVTNKPNWTANAAATCDQFLALYCFPDAPPAGARVFVTSGFMNLNADSPSGVAVGDAICNQLATRAKLSGTFVAWLSDGQTNAIDRIADRAYFLLDDRRVAASKADLTDGTLENPIEVDETGAVVEPDEAGPFVWTGTNSAGLADQHCNGWISGRAVDGKQGLHYTTGSSWTAVGSSACSGPGRLYCFEAPKSAITPRVD
jgi:hypothetical protein